jgi:hypothetical protein
MSQSTTRTGKPGSRATLSSILENLVSSRLTHPGEKMMVFIRHLLGFALPMVLSIAVAQDFPQGSSAPTNEEIKKYLENRVLDAKIADGTSWRLEYKSSGYFFINTSRGFNSDGKWQVEDGKLCGQLKGRDRTCNEVRMHAGLLLYKRDNGEVVQFTPQ